MSSDPWRHSHEKIAGGEVRTVAFHAMVRDVFTDPHECLCQYVGIDHFVCEHRLGMNICAVASLLDVDPPLLKRDIVDGSELVPADIVEVLAATEFRFLRRKAY